MVVMFGSGIISAAAALSATDLFLDATSASSTRTPSAPPSQGRRQLHLHPPLAARLLRQVLYRAGNNEVSMPFASSDVEHGSPYERVWKRRSRLYCAGQPHLTLRIAHPVRDPLESPAPVLVRLRERAGLWLRPPMASGWIAHRPPGYPAPAHLG
jgi:hypothetical protein